MFSGRDRLSHPSARGRCFAATQPSPYPFAVFAYIDPTIRARLIESGKLARIDARGSELPADAEGDGQGTLLNVLGPIPMPIQVGDEEIRFSWYTFVRHTELTTANEMAEGLRGSGEPHLFPLMASAMSVNSALVYGDLRQADAPLIRVHSCCLTGDVFGSKRCECGPQLEAAFQRIQEAGAPSALR